MIFQTILKQFESLGNYRVQAFQKAQRFNVKIAAIIFLFFTFTVSSVLFLVIEANSSKDYADSFYLSTTTVSGSLAVVIVIWNADKFYSLCDKFQNTIQKRKLSFTSDSKL